MTGWSRELLVIPVDVADWLQLAAAAALFLWAFWGVYVLVMGLYRAHLAKQLTRPTYVLAAPWLLIGYAMDVLANLVLATLIFLEPPREWLVTDRLQRHLPHIGWRGNLARWICSHLLDVFDPSGKHC